MPPPGSSASSGRASSFLAGRYRAALLASCSLVVAATADDALGQVWGVGGFGLRSVGGISIDTDGVVLTIDQNLLDESVRVTRAAVSKRSGRPLLQLQELLVAQRAMGRDPAAVTHRQQLDARAGLDLHGLTDERLLALPRYGVAKRVPTVANGLKKGSPCVLSASGGVLLKPWQLAGNTPRTEGLDATRAAWLAARPATQPASAFWWD